ncbi:MAG TPA: family 10 glycosylhydrolase [bacterium]|nr:family 10 glycosylhydrolase [bacterium]
MLKRIFILIIMIGFGLNQFHTCSHNIPIKEDQQKLEDVSRIIDADKINPADTTFPGGRGSNQMVIYTSKYDDSTGTNQWGLEATIRNDTVISVAGNNSAIPDNGFVVSGHGNMQKWISQNLFPGIIVRREGNRITAITNTDSYLYHSRHLLRKAKNLQNQNYAFPKKTIDSIDNIYRKLVNLSKISKQDDNLQNAKRYAQESLQKARDIYYYSFPSRNEEIRACWMRIRSKSPQELEQTIKNIKALGFNTICPETIYGGYTIYPNSVKSLKQNPKFKGWDPLQELTSLCDKYDIRLVPWVWVFFIGNKNSPLIEEKANWMGKSRQGEIYSRVEQGYHFFCPARKEVHKFWLKVYEDLLQNYDIDGLQLDYIRYPVSLPFELGYCYCGHCRQDFKKVNGYDPLKITPQKNPEIWREWNNYRRVQINSFVKSTSILKDSLAPQIELSADVFPDTESSKASKFQNWPLWLKENYLDEIFTMSYTPAVERVGIQSKFLKKNLRSDIKGYVGLGPYMGFSADVLLEEIYAVQQAGVDGICLFNYSNLSQAQIEALQKGPFRKDAQRPDAL